MIPTRQKRRLEFVESIKEDIKWLGADWGDQPLTLHPIILIRCMKHAIKLIKKGKAYVCDLTADRDP